MKKSIRTIAVSPDCRLLAAAGHDSSLHFWHLGRDTWMSSGVQVNAQINAITSMKYSPDGSTLAMAGLDNRIVLWPMAEKSKDDARVLQGHASNVAHIQFIRKGDQLASVGMDGQVLYWDLEKARIVRECHLDLGLAYRVEMSEDGTRLVTGCTNGTVGVYSL